MSKDKGQLLRSHHHRQSYRAAGLTQPQRYNFVVVERGQAFLGRFLPRNKQSWYACLAKRLMVAGGRRFSHAA
jgi:hypothetical protein